MDFDAIVIGSGPNGLAGAIELARAGCAVAVFETRDTPGGGARSSELTLPGFVHDVCSAVHPMALASPFFKTLALQDLGLEWVHPDIPVAHTLSGGSVLLYRSLKETAFGLGEDASRYMRLLERFVRRSDWLMRDILAPAHVPFYPFLLAAFGRYAIGSARSFVDSNFVTERGRALFGGIAAHSSLPLDSRPTAAFGLVLTILGHAVGWPVPRGGSQRIVEALVTYLTSLGGRIYTGHRIDSLADLPSSNVVLCDVTPRQLLQMIPDKDREAFGSGWRQYRYGPGVFKLDWALNAPVPWRDEGCRRAATVHIGGSFEEIAASEHLANHGDHSDEPYIILTQPSLFDSTRAPAGSHTAWAYCHVPHGSTLDMTRQIEERIEREAPGFRDCIIARRSMTASELETYNANYVGGDINGGIQDLSQLFRRPVSILHPYRTPLRGVYVCSSSTPPGGAVHGMCGYHAARAALEDLGIPAYNSENP